MIKRNKFSYQFWKENIAPLQLIPNCLSLYNNVCVFKFIRYSVVFELRFFFGRGPQHLFVHFWVLDSWSTSFASCFVDEWRDRRIRTTAALSRFTTRAINKEVCIWLIPQRVIPANFTLPPLIALSELLCISPVVVAKNPFHCVNVILIDEEK